MAMTARVVRTASNSVTAEWHITVRREPAGYLGDPEVQSPLVDDVPPDIREALQKWLRSAEGLDGCWNFQPAGDPDASRMVVPSTVCRNCGRPYRDHV